MQRVKQFLAADDKLCIIVISCVIWKLQPILVLWILIWKDVKGSFDFQEAGDFFYYIKFRSRPSVLLKCNQIPLYMYLIQKFTGYFWKH